MASEYDEGEESVLEPTNPTLLDAIEEKNRAIGKSDMGSESKGKDVKAKAGASKHAPTKSGVMGAVYIAGKLQASKKGAKKKTVVVYENLLQAQMKMKLSDPEGVSIIKKNLIHRMVCISRLKDNASDPNSIGRKTAAVDHYEKLFKYLQNMYQSEPITGLLLIYHKHMVHVIETSSDMLLKYVQDLQKIEQDETSFAAKSKILVVSHDIPDRLYGQWSFRGLDIQAHSLDQNDNNDDTYNVVGDVLTQLVKLGVYLSKQPKLNLKSAMDSLYEKVPELLPQQGTIHSLLMNDDNCMILPKEYLAMYEEPFDFTLDSELSWPLPTRLFPYN